MNEPTSSAQPCKLCGSAPRNTGIALNFRCHALLPESVQMLYCPACDFMFATPCVEEAYAQYYAKNTNDQVGLHDALTVLDAARYEAQAKILRPFLQGRTELSVLDFGCGRAGLLSVLSQTFPENKYTGFDPNVQRCQHGAIELTDAMADIDCPFDLIIISHTVEHLVGFDILKVLSDKLSPQGLLFVEVPDASRYDRYPRKEFMYQLDRLHINHFSTGSLEKLLGNCGLKKLASGTNDFEYKDGHLYPAIYMLAGLAGTTVESRPTLVPPGLDVQLHRYCQVEAIKAERTRQRLVDSPIVVYGFGDNFFRSSGSKGPLENANIVAVVDRDHQALKASAYAADYLFMSLEESMRYAKDYPFVITVSWGALTIEQQLKDLGVLETVLV
jgi:hypothetical protein